MRETLSGCQVVNVSTCDCLEENETWPYAIKIIIAIIIIVENMILLVAILRNWNILIRQHNLYRYVLSLVAADLLNGITLLVHTVFHIAASVTEIVIDHDDFQDVLRNLIIGTLYGLTFASLASASLLNVVLRIGSTRALARAAAIKKHSCSVSFRSPKITIWLISVIWTITVIFIIVPMLDHCHNDIVECFNATTNSRVFYVVNESSLIEFGNYLEAQDCSILRPPARSSYLLVLNSFITSALALMVMCNIYTICMTTSVQKAEEYIPGKNNLKLKHTFGIVRDTSSFFACVITVSMTISTLPFVIFTFVTESGSPHQRSECGSTVPESFSQFVELIKYFSSAVNPIIYPAIFTRLRSDIVRLLVWQKKFVGLPRKKEKFNAELLVRKSTLNEMQCSQCFHNHNLKS